jgi:hypothetical protein
VAGIAVASGQFINQSIKLADVKRAINQSENSLSINQVKALKLELIDYAHLWIAYTAGRPLWGRAPRWNIKTDLTPRAPATISRVRMGFSVLKNTRIASGRRRILPARTWGVSTVFLSNNHGQTVMVGFRPH